jgi:L-lactate dehydrogenase
MPDTLGRAPAAAPATVAASAPSPFVPMARLEAFARALFSAAGMDAEKAATVARLLVLTDAMGRRTHGLAMAPLYLADIEKGRASGGAEAGMAARGEPEVLKDSGITAVWDGRHLPGLWLVAEAIERVIPRAAAHGMAAVAIRRSQPPRSSTAKRGASRSASRKLGRSIANSTSRTRR